jgi:multicomponent Na+:H+ antiporter subunit D
VTHEHLLTTSPVLVPLVTAIVCALTASKDRVTRAVSVAGTIVLLGCAGWLVATTASGETLTTRFGNWPTPIAISFRIDRLSAVMIVITASIAVLASMYGFVAASDRTNGKGRWVPCLVHGLLAGVGGAYATADLFNLYVWFEVLLITALGLVAVTGERQHLEAALKYLTLNLFGTLLLLVAVTGLYGLTGQLSFDALRAALTGAGADPLARTLIALLLVSLLVKAGAFPFFFWLPVGYSVASPATQALFAAVTTKVGAYVVLRVLGEIDSLAMTTFSTPLGWLAVATMITGVLGAAYHYDVRRILAFHSVSQIGYILLATAVGGVGGYTAAVFFILHHIVVKANLFLIGGLVARSTGSFDLREIGGLYRERPVVALLFAISAASLVGIPPLSGFWAKWLVVSESFAAERYAWGAAALAVGGLTLFSMSKIWIEAFWKDAPTPSALSSERLPAAPVLACGALAATAIGVGLAPDALLALLQTAASSLSGGTAGGVP